MRKLPAVRFLLSNQSAEDRKTDCSLGENSNWQNNTIKEIYKQANSGGVLLSSMGNPKPFPVYWDKILINASPGNKSLH